jgi:DNA-binding NarL/FixJ family response regulator
MRVYLVEPSALVRERLQRVLAQHPSAELLGCCDGARDAESLLERLRPDLIILDLSLREGNGFQLLRAIGCWPLPPEVLVLTNDAQEPFRRVARSLGVRHFFDKTLEFEQAIDTLGLLSSRWPGRRETDSVLET